MLHISELAARRSGRAAVTALAVAVACGALSACGGGGGGSSASAAPAPAPPPPPPSSGWMSGVFMPSAGFAAECAVPRSGTDPATAQPFPDVAGSVLRENNWLRSWSNELYLWYDEILDRDPGLYSTSDYFGLLKTAQRTPSGALKDQFHFTIPSAEWHALSQSGVSVGYGVEWALLAAVPPREAVVLYTQPNSPAADDNLTRGSRLVSVDGRDFVNDNTQQGVDIINAALFPAQAGETHTFVVEELGATRTITLEADEVTSAPVLDVGTLDTPTGRVGYLLFNDHIATAEQALIDAVTALEQENIDDLVLDVRYNGGGFLVIASQLAYMIAGPGPTGGRVFEAMRFNDKHATTNPVTGQPLAPLPFVDTTVGLSAAANPPQPLPTLDLARVFVLTGPDTCSASESIINGLRGAGVEVVQIGSTTCGKPYGFYPQDNCGTTYFSIQFQGVNDDGFGDYADGFAPANTPGTTGTTVPGCAVVDDYARALGDPAEARFATALAYRDQGAAACPAPTFGAFGASKPGTASAPAEGRMLRSPWRENRILLP